ncbi:MAG: hypothetical protein ACFE9T_10650 [Promethearchaeota archaeon]
MIKKNTLFAVFGILFFLSLIYFLPIAHGYNYTFIDAEDDVYYYCQSTNETLKGDYHDEIDIVYLNISGKYVTFTIKGDFIDWNDSHWATLIFSSEFIPYGGPIDYAWRPPYYSLDFEVSSFFVTLERGYSLGGNKFAYEEWNGTAWENRTTATPANILSVVSQHYIIAYIPDAVEEIPSNMKCLLYTEFWQSPYDCIYADFAPALPTRGGGDNISGYNLFILICVMIGISILLKRNRNKLK